MKLKLAYLLFSPFLLLAGEAPFWGLTWEEASVVQKGDSYDPNQILDDFVFGAVYFRRTNPPPEDWARDYAQAEKDGHNIFRHWFLWGAIEKEPGVYDFSEYDPHFDLAAKHGIKVIIGEMLTSAPEWAFARWPEARLENRDGTRDRSGMNAAVISGGFPGLSLNHPEVREAAGKFLQTMAEYYKDHPALGGYDLANEMKFPQSPNGEQADYDFGPATQRKFRTWLKHRYGSLDHLKRKWNRLGYTAWSQVEAPRHHGPYPDVLDWLEFRLDDFHEQVQWRANVLREVDPDHPITAHAKGYAMRRMATSVNNAWMGAPITELYGFTWSPPSQGLDAWYQMHAVDLIRSACQGKDFWYAEASSGDKWTSGRDRDDGKIMLPRDIELINMLAFAGGSQGILNPRWRSLLAGPLHGAYGYYALDGSPTPRSEIASKMAKWGKAAESKALWEADPVPGEIGILVVPESQLYLYAYDLEEDMYPETARGAYRAFYDQQIQADWVYIDHIDEHDLLYLPAPMMLKEKTVETLKRWVVDGGTLISEAAPAYVTDLGWVGETQPRFGLDAVFGVMEADVEFGTDLSEGLILDSWGHAVPLGWSRQEYQLKGGQPLAHFSNGALGLVEHRYGKGRTLLIGANPGHAYFHDPGQPWAAWFSSLLEWAGQEKHLDVKTSAEGLVARLHRHEDGRHFLWVVNGSLDTVKADIGLNSNHGIVKDLALKWGNKPAVLKQGRIHLELEPRRSLVLELITSN